MRKRPHDHSRSSSKQDTRHRGRTAPTIYLYSANHVLSHLWHVQMNANCSGRGKWALRFPAHLRSPVPNLGWHIESSASYCLWGTLGASVVPAKKWGCSTWQEGLRCSGKSTLGGVTGSQFQSRLCSSSLMIGVKAPCLTSRFQILRQQYVTSPWKLNLYTNVRCTVVTDYV